MCEFNIGDRFFVPNQTEYPFGPLIGGIMVLSVLRDECDNDEDVFKYYFEKPDDSRTDKYDGNVSASSLRQGNIIGSDLILFKIRDDKHLLELKLRYG